MPYFEPNWDEIKNALLKEDFEETDEAGVKRRSVFLGTVFNMSPSGKYYTPWANSNVSEEEAKEDSEYWEKLEEDAVPYGITIEFGEGDPCDVFAAEYQNLGE